MPLGADFNMHTNGNMEEKKLTLRVFYLAKASLISACYSFSLKQFFFSFFHRTTELQSTCFVSISRYYLVSFIREIQFVNYRIDTDWFH